MQRGATTRTAVRGSRLHEGQGQSQEAHSRRLANNVLQSVCVPATHTHRTNPVILLAPLFCRTGKAASHTQRSEVRVQSSGMRRRVVLQVVANVLVEVSTASCIAVWKVIRDEISGLHGDGYEGD